MYGSHHGDLGPQFEHVGGLFTSQAVRRASSRRLGGVTGDDERWPYGLAVDLGNGNGQAECSGMIVPRDLERCARPTLCANVDPPSVTPVLEQG